MTTDRSRRWCFTINDGLEIDELLEVGEKTALPKSLSFIRYIIYSQELSASGHTHLQGFLILDKPQRRSYLKTNFLHGGHYEVTRGTSKQAAAYCEKSDTHVNGPWEFGKMTDQGTRTDLIKIKEAIDAGKQDKEIIDEDPRCFGPMIRYHKGFQWYRNLTVVHRTENANIVVWGPGGTGKSTWAEENFPDAYWKPPGTRWFDGYKGEKVVIYDDFKDNWFDETLFKRLCQKQPCQVELKGDSTEYVATINVFTSNTDPHNWYKSDPAVRRRLEDPCGVIYLYQKNPVTQVREFVEW